MVRYSKEDRKAAKLEELPLFTIDINGLHLPDKKQRRASSVKGRATPEVELAVRRALLIAHEMSADEVERHLQKNYPHLFKEPHART